MSELRLRVRRDSLRGNDDCAWASRDAACRVIASGRTLQGLPKAGRCNLVVAADLVNVVPARLPDWPQRRLRPLLLGAAEAHVLAGSDPVHVAWLGRDDAGISWLAVVDAKWLNETVALLAERGLAVDAVVPESLLLPLETGAWSLWVHEETVLLKAAPVYGVALEPGAPPAGLTLALNGVHGLPGGRPDRLCVYSAGPLPEDERRSWEESCGLRIEWRGAWDWRDATWPAAVNLLPGPTRWWWLGLDVRGLLRPLAAGAMALAAIQVAGTAIDWRLLSSEWHRLDAEMRTLAASVLPANAAIVDPAWQVGSKLRDLRAVQGGDPDGMLALLSHAGRAQPSGEMPELKGVDYRNGRLVLEYAAADAGWAGRFRSALEAQGLVADVTSAAAGTVAVTVSRAAEVAGRARDHVQ